MSPGCKKVLLILTIGWSEIEDLAFPDEVMPNFDDVDLEFRRDMSFPSLTN
jgi:hypothetical protein